MSKLMQALAVLRPGANCADTDGTLENVRWDNPPEGFVAPTQAEIDLYLARSTKLSAARAAFDRCIADGVPHAGKVIQIGDSSRADISGKSAEALAAITPDSGVVWDIGSAWRTADNSYLSLPAPQAMLALGAAVSTRYSALRRRLGQLKDSIAAAETAEAVEAVDVDADW